MRIAYCMSGAVGGLRGKSGEKLGGSDVVLRESFKTTKRNIIDINQGIDIFIYTWDIDLENTMIEYYRPKKIVATKQKIFDIPEHLPNDLRVQSHYSRWYGNQQVIELKKQYEQENNFIYDLVVVARLDLWWLVPINLSQCEPQFFWVPHQTVNINNQRIQWGYPLVDEEILDQIFISNSKNMDLFYTLYNHLDEYTLPGQCKSWRSISSHYLALWHLRKLNMIDIIKFGLICYNYKSFSKNDLFHFTLVRYLIDFDEFKYLFKGNKNE